MAELLKYRVHDMAAVFPLPSPEEYAAIKDDVLQRGFIYPAVHWEDAKKDSWLIDGRTRDRIATELEKAGVKKAANGEEIVLKRVNFNGTEAEAVQYVRSLNLTRRAMTSSQKAAAAVLAGDLYRKYKAKEDGVDLTELEAEDAGDMASRVAKEAGTNRAYVFDCAKLHRERPHLLQAVLSGVYSIPEAKKRAARLADGLPEEEPEGGVEPVEVEPDKPDGEVILDGLRNPVAADLIPTFRFRNTVKEVRKAINNAVEQVKAACEGIDAKNVSFQTVKGDANNVVRHLEDHQPHAPCPHCSGTGKEGDPENPDKKCGHCKGRRFLDRIQWGQVPPGLRAMFEGKKTDAPEDGSGYGQS